LIVHFLGTSAAEGWPGLFCQCDNCAKARALGGKNIRTRSSIIIDKIFKVDLPPDNYLHTLKYGINLSDVKHLFITHTHYDHFHPDDLSMRRKPFAHLKEEFPLHIYGNDNVIAEVKRIVEAHPDVNIITHRVTPFKEFEAGGMKVTPLLADHAENQTSLLFVFQLHNKTILHGYDSGWFPDKTWSELENFRLDLAILDCTNGALPYIRGHMGVKGVIETAKRMRKNGIADKDTVFVATHFSHNGGLLHQDLVEKLEPEGVTVAYDGLKIKL